MKAFKLDLSEYPISVLPGQPEPKDANGKPLMYPVRNNLIELMFSPRLKLNSIDLLKTQALSMRILDESADSILLNDDENRLVRNAEQTYDGYRMIDVPLVERLRNMPEVEVEEKKDVDTSQ